MLVISVHPLKAWKLTTGREDRVEVYDPKKWLDGHERKTVVLHANHERHSPTMHQVRDGAPSKLPSNAFIGYARLASIRGPDSPLAEEGQLDTVLWLYAQWPLADRRVVKYRKRKRQSLFNLPRGYWDKVFPPASPMLAGLACPSCGVHIKPGDGVMSANSGRSICLECAGLACFG